MKSFFPILFSAVLFRLVSPAMAENENPYSVRAWTSEDGLPENKVVGVAQTPDGYLWVATQGGLVRFDGVRFQQFEAASTAGFVSRTMRVLYLDGSDRLWLAKEGGVLVCIDGATVRTLTPKDGLPQLDFNDGQRSLAQEKDGSLWISYSRGTVVRFKDGHVDVFPARDGLPTKGICFFCTDRDGQLWFVKGGQVGVFRDGKFVTLLDLSPNYARIAPARAGGIWICVNHQVLKFNEGSRPVALAELPASRGDLNVTAMLEDHEGAVWVGTAFNGLFRCDSNSVASVGTTYSAISSLAEDLEGNLWVGTLGGGLNCVQPRVISLIGTAEGLPFEGVYSVCRDASGALWAVGQNGVLARQQGAKWVTPTLDKEAAEVHATCVAADSTGTVWIGTAQGTLYRWTNGQFSNFTFADGVHKGSVRSLLTTASEDLWIATDSANTSNSLYRIRNGNVRCFDLPPGQRLIRAMAEDVDGNFWAGASDGLLVRVTGETLVDETAKFPRFSIRCLHGSRDGSLWIGYAGFGVGCLRDGRMTRFTSDQGLPNDYVSQILEDDRGDIWFAGNQGVFQVRRQEFDDVAAGRSAWLRPVLYGHNKGMPNMQANFDYCPNASRPEGGQLIFSMLTGLVQVQPDRVQLNRLEPDVIVERVVADGQLLAAYQTSGSPVATNAPAPIELDSVDKKNEIRLPAGVQQIQFDFTALSFVAPENVQFRYQLEGLDQGWVDAGTQRLAQYTHLPPGKYRFKVIACNNDRIWNKTGVTLAVIQKPKIWETLWFKGLVAAATLWIISGAVAIVLRRRHQLVVERLEHQRGLEFERTRIARDLHDDLGVGLTEIGLLGDLAGASSELPQTSRERLEEITGRARTLAASLDEIVWAINPANDTSQSLVDYFFPYAQKLLGCAGIRCRFEVIEPLPAGDLNAEERHEFFHAYKEALNNIIRHSGATQVQITISAGQGNLLVRIADNGCGLEDTAGNGAHHGLAGMRERLLLLGGRCEITGTADKGTTVIFNIPVQPEL
ncbi:MAG: two-component regulator propeller domain-containing protein [Verrucomicrobiota bacterium]